MELLVIGERWGLKKNGAKQTPPERRGNFEPAGIE